jgi:uncharacterized DUF497 family protein
MVSICPARRSLSSAVKYQSLLSPKTAGRSAAISVSGFKALDRFEQALAVDDSEDVDRLANESVDQAVAMLRVAALSLMRYDLRRVSIKIVYDFEWDATKALSNRAKHGVTFEQAAMVFLDAFALTVFDSIHGQHEERWFTLGYDARGKLLAVAHTYQTTGAAGARVRIISAREATKREQRFYEEEPR